MRAVRLVDVLVPWIVLVGACSSFDSSPPTAVDANPSDAGVSDAGTGGPDAAVDDAGVRCDRNAPFTSHRPIDGVNTPEAEAYARVSPDERVIYFQRSFATDGRVELYRASRASKTEAFGTPVLLAGLPTGARQPFVTADELEILFVLKLGDPSSPFTLMHARRNAVTEPFGDAAPYPITEDPNGIVPDRQTPSISADGSELFFASPSQGNNIDLYRAIRTEDGNFGIPEPLDTLNASTTDNVPVLSPDRLSLYFYSERNLGADKGTIMVAHRDTPTGPFRAPVRVEELTFPGYFSIPGSVSADNCRLYFSSNKEAEATSYDLYVAERSPP